MRTTMKLRGVVAALLVASAPLAAKAATAITSTDVEKQTTRLDTTAQNKGQTQVATRIASSFTSLAGSDANSLKLVQGLRNGTAITLTTVSATTTGTTPATTTITPPTGKMGWGNVFISLALAKAVLANAGITNPTTQQLQAALMGGSVTGADGSTVTLKGVLQMRADGMGWGQIAQASGTKLGPVVSSIKSAHASVSSWPASGTTTTASAASTSKGVTTANGTTTGSGNSSKGITTASGASAAHGSRGLVTAGGTAAGTVTHGNSANAPGRGIVTASGGGAGNVTAATGSSHGHGAGVVSAGGATVGSGLTHGNSANSNAGGNGNGKGKGGG